MFIFSLFFGYLFGIILISANFIKYFEINMYKRFHIATRHAPPLRTQPSKYVVRIRKSKFVQMLVEAFLSNSLWDMPKRLKSRPCIYGVYSRLSGGLTPKHINCVACYRCVVEHPDMIRVELNSDYKKLGDSYWTPEQVWSAWYEATTGRIPVKGAGYKGPFAGAGFDSMWTDMSEIVRPTRDGIHGREFISTIVDIGKKPQKIEFNKTAKTNDNENPILQIPIPIIFDALPKSLVNQNILSTLTRAASELNTFVIIPADFITQELMKFSHHIIPLVNSQNWNKNKEIMEGARIIEIEAEDRLNVWKDLRDNYPSTVISLRLPFRKDVEDLVVKLVREGAEVFHLFADYHGREFFTQNPKFVKDLIRSVHLKLVDEAIRDEVTIIASGGIIAAEHLPKAIICGSDLVAINTPLLVALQCEFLGDCISRDACQWNVPRINMKWGTQRIVNLVGAWHGQLLEILGAMGLREVRRLRGEAGRAMFFEDLEQEVFGQMFGEKK